MTELLLTFVGGLLGSSHCLGMCGGFALTIGAHSASAGANLRRQIVYSAGRIFTYAMAGAIAGYAGMRLIHAAPSLVHAQAVLAIAAGLLLVVQGAKAAGLWPRRSIAVGRHPCLTPSLLTPYLRSPGWTNAFLAGVFTGFLPCGLVYAFLALASSTGDLAAGMGRMAAFGLGTAPLMIAVGGGGSLLSLAARRRALRAAAWCVLVSGGLSIARGIGFIDWVGSEISGCPWCR